MLNVVALRTVQAGDEAGVGVGLVQLAEQIARLSRTVADLPVGGEAKAAALTGLCDATLALRRAAEALEVGLLDQIGC